MIKITPRLKVKWNASLLSEEGERIPPVITHLIQKGATKLSIEDHRTDNRYPCLIFRLEHPDSETIKFLGKQHKGEQSTRSKHTGISLSLLFENGAPRYDLIGASHTTTYSTNSTITYRNAGLEDVKKSAKVMKTILLKAASMPQAHSSLKEVYRHLRHLNEHVLPLKQSTDGSFQPTEIELPIHYRKK